MVVWPNWKGCVWELIDRQAGSWEEWSLLAISQVQWYMPGHSSFWKTDAGGTQAGFGYIVRLCFKNTPNKQTNKNELGVPVILPAERLG